MYHVDSPSTPDLTLGSTTGPYDSRIPSVGSNPHAQATMRIRKTASTTEWNPAMNHRILGIQSTPDLTSPDMEWTDPWTRNLAPNVLYTNKNLCQIFDQEESDQENLASYLSSPAREKERPHHTLQDLIDLESQHIASFTSMDDESFISRTLNRFEFEDSPSTSLSQDIEAIVANRESFYTALSHNSESSLDNYLRMTSSPTVAFEDTPPPLPSKSPRPESFSSPDIDGQRSSSYTRPKVRRVESPLPNLSQSVSPSKPLPLLPTDLVPDQDNTTTPKPSGKLGSFFKSKNGTIKSRKNSSHSFQTPHHSPINSYSLLHLPSFQAFIPPSPNSISTDGVALNFSPEDNRTWKSTMSDAEFYRLTQLEGETEMKRQEVIWELCETEKMFVMGICGVIRIFMMPLRNPNTGHWIPGVPIPVARIFDWLQDIVLLHSQISSMLQGLRLEEHDMVTYLAEHLAPFIPQFEIYQPYLIRFESVISLLEKLMLNPSNEFGEFLRQQNQHQECNGLSLSSFLLKPVQRLMKYPLLFREILKLTPVSHKDHAATKLLFSMTDDLIRVLQEVKSREDDVAKLEALETHIHGLPEHFRLAERDRVLLHSGPLRYTIIGERKSKEPTLPHLPPRSVSLSTPASPYYEHEGWRRSVVSDSGSSIGSLTMSDYSRTSTASPITPAAISPMFELTHQHSPNVDDHLSLIEKKNIFGRPRTKELLIYAFVFSDVVLFTEEEIKTGSRFKNTSKTAKRTTSSYRLLDDVGLCRVHNVLNFSGKPTHSCLFGLEVSPILPFHASIPSPRSMYLSTLIKDKSQGDKTQEDLVVWQRVFNQSRTIRASSASSPAASRHSSLRPGETIHFTPEEKKSAMDRLIIDSQENCTTIKGQEERYQTREREERAWWTRRFRSIHLITTPTSYI